MSDHDYDPEKIRGAIQDWLYRLSETLGDAEPPQSAEEIEDGVRVHYSPSTDRCYIFFRVMGSWFNFDVPRAEIEKEPTIAEEFVSGERKKYTGEITIDHRYEINRHKYAVIRFEDGSEVCFDSCSWRAL